MDYHGPNVITLGDFLERYCFRESYACPSEGCDTPMVNHVRRFIHGHGSLQVILKRLDLAIPGSSTNIVMWSWCRLCKQVGTLELISCKKVNVCWITMFICRQMGGKCPNLGWSISFFSPSHLASCTLVYVDRCHHLLPHLPVFRHLVL